MKRITRCFSRPLFLLIVIIGRFASGQTVAINYTDRGWYTPTGDHIPTNTNYSVFDFSADGSGTLASHDFFVFNLAGITQPISSARLALYLPGGSEPGYQSPDPSETFELHDVSTSIAALVAGTGGVAAWDDLGSGLVYGNRTITPADMGNVVEIDLNASAISAMNANHGLFGIGGSIATLDSPGVEQLFGFTQVDTYVTQLRLTLVPEPSTLFLLAIGAIGTLSGRKLRRKEPICRRY